jgi:UDP-N-acetylmuramoyl-L-alanyl-D-glutamate--2,6-diaminopimelate ligase
MGKIAERYCEHIVLTNEDPYDEDPRKIIDDVTRGIQNQQKLSIIMDRREAIRFAIEKVRPGGYVIVSGKGTDPFIMGPNNTKEPWSDATVVQEELARLS